MYWSRPPAATLSLAEQWIRTYLQAKTYFQRAGQLVNAHGHCEEARMHYAAAKQLFLGLSEKQLPRGLSNHSRIDSEGRIIQACTFSVDALHCLAHSSMSGYAEAQDCLDQAEKLIGHGLAPTVLPYLREAMLPFKQKNKELKHNLQMEREVLFENDQEVRFFHEEYARSRAHSVARQKMEREAVQSRQADFSVQEENTTELNEGLWHGDEHDAPLFSLPQAPPAPSFTMFEQSNAKTITSPAPPSVTSSYPPDWFISYPTQKPSDVSQLETGSVHGLGIYQNFHRQAMHQNFHGQSMYQNLQDFQGQTMYQNSLGLHQSIGPAYGASNPSTMYNGSARPGRHSITEYGNFQPAVRVNSGHPQEPSFIFRPDFYYLQ